MVVVLNFFLLYPKHFFFLEVKVSLAKKIYHVAMPDFLLLLVPMYIFFWRVYEYFTFGAIRSKGAKSYSTSYVKYSKDGRMTLFSYSGELTFLHLVTRAILTKISQHTL